MSERLRARLGDYVDLLTGFPFKSADYSSDGTDVRLLRGDNIVQGRLRWSGARRWPEHLRTGHAAYESSRREMLSLRWTGRGSRQA